MSMRFWEIDGICEMQIALGSQVEEVKARVDMYGNKCYLMLITFDKEKINCGVSNKGLL